MKNDYKEINFVDKDTMLTGCSGRRPSMTGGNKDTMSLDARIKYEHDNMEFSSLSPSDSDTDTLSPLDNNTSSLSFPCLTRESRNEESDSINKDINSNWIFGSTPEHDRR